MMITRQLPYQLNCFMTNTKKHSMEICRMRWLQQDTTELLTDVNAILMSNLHIYNLVNFSDVNVKCLWNIFLFDWDQERSKSRKNGPCFVYLCLGLLLTTQTCSRFTPIVWKVKTPAWFSMGKPIGAIKHLIHPQFHIQGTDKIKVHLLKRS